MRKIALLLMLAAAPAVSHAANYTCKDPKSGKWTEEACTGAAKPAEQPKPFDWNGWRPKIGMTDAEMHSMIESAYRTNGGDWRCCNEWLHHPDVKRTTTSRGIREQWIFRIGDGDAKYLYFDNGVLTSISE